MGKFKVAINKKKLTILSLAAYLLILAVLYSSAVISAKKNTLAWVEGNMGKNLDTLLLNSDAEFSRRSAYMDGLVRNNSMRMPLGFGLYQQVRDFLEQDESIVKGENKIIVVGSKNEVVFNNTGYFRDFSLALHSTVFSGYIYDEGRIFRINYFPVFLSYISESNTVKQIGAVISVYDFLDAFRIKEQDADSICYVYYISVQNKLHYIIDEKTGSINSVLNTVDPEKKNVPESPKLVFDKQFQLIENNGSMTLSIGIPNSRYKPSENVYLLESIKNSTYAALIISAIMIFVYFMLKKDFLNRLEIQSLRTQRHDFSKHIDVIRGMAVMDQFEEIKDYVESLGEKVSFAGKLSNIGCPALGVLIEEEKEYAENNNIIFNLNVIESIAPIRVRPDDLCVIMGNLIDNAIEACLEVPDSQGMISIELGMSKGHSYFMVSNNGKTISENNIEKIFMPGYSTKSNPKSRGMGLHIVSRTLRKYRGSIKVDSTHGLTVFTVYIPV